VAFEIGNEPDLAFRDDRYRVEDYVREFRSFAAAFRERVPGARFVGPGATYYRSNELQSLTRGTDEWTIPFANMAGGKEIVQLTEHIYVVGQPDGTEPEEVCCEHPDSAEFRISRPLYRGPREAGESCGEKRYSVPDQ
jgi:hypothetical protein